MKEIKMYRTVWGLTDACEAYVRREEETAYSNCDAWAVENITFHDEFENLFEIDKVYEGYIDTRDDYALFICWLDKEVGIQKTPLYDSPLTEGLYETNMRVIVVKRWNGSADVYFNDDCIPESYQIECFRDELKTLLNILG